MAESVLRRNETTFRNGEQWKRDDESMTEKEEMHPGEKGVGSGRKRTLVNAA